MLLHLNMLLYTQLLIGNEKIPVYIYIYSYMQGSARAG